MVLKLQFHQLPFGILARGHNHLRIRADANVASAFLSFCISIPAIKEMFEDDIYKVD